MPNFAPMAQWIARFATDEKAAGSNPAGGASGLDHKIGPGRVLTLPGPTAMLVPTSYPNTKELVMQVRNGDIVELRDGRIVVVTDAADPGEPVGEYQTISRTAWLEQGIEVVTSSMPAETIFVGQGQNGGTVVSDMSEVVSILS